MPKNALITYPRKKTTPPTYAPPLPPDIGGLADLAFACAQLSTSAARLGNTFRAVTEEFDATLRHLVELDKREAAERAYFPLVTPLDPT